MTSERHSGECHDARLLTGTAGGRLAILYEYTRNSQAWTDEKFNKKGWLITAPQLLMTCKNPPRVDFPDASEHDFPLARMLLWLRMELKR